MHMTAEALEGIKSEIQNLMIQVSIRPPEAMRPRMMNRMRRRKGKVTRSRTEGMTRKMMALVWSDGNRSDWP